MNDLIGIAVVSSVLGVLIPHLSGETMKPFVRFLAGMAVLVLLCEPVAAAAASLRDVTADFFEQLIPDTGTMEESGASNGSDAERTAAARIAEIASLLLQEAYALEPDTFSVNGTCSFTDGSGCLTVTLSSSCMDAAEEIHSLLSVLCEGWEIIITEGRE